eukprot:s4803_g3.t1
MAENAFATLTSGLDLMQLPLEQIARLRDPCIGKWKPFCNILATGAACVAVLRQHDRPCGNTCCQQERGRMLFQQLHDAPCLTDVWKGMWEPIPRNVLRTRSCNHPGDGFAWFSMTLVTRVLDCADSRNQRDLRSEGPDPHGQGQDAQRSATALC